MSICPICRTPFISSIKLQQHIVQQHKEHKINLRNPATPFPFEYTLKQAINDNDPTLRNPATPFPFEHTLKQAINDNGPTLRNPATPFPFEHTLKRTINDNGPILRNSAAPFPFEHTLKRTINDNGPILRSPANPSDSVLLEAEGLIKRPIKTLRVTRWAELDLDRETKKRINREIQDWIRTEGNHHLRFEQLLYQARPSDGIERGISLFAREDLAPYTVLGPYAGILHDDTLPDSLSRERRKMGTTNIHKYTFQTLSSKRLISSFSSGNILSLMNTAKLPEYPALPGKKNNVSSIMVGKNIIFYITNQSVQKDEELLIDYGTKYESEPNAKKLKQEALSRSPSPGPSWKK
ncbi:SET domain-containing protein-lysine N-methyltransferase [Xenorhabdus bharatensis]|uniref:SET domain-containing protein-lysine N-methyltransferase n=1 Tax=Xenorhabdus bharatensis TaxID=3136256 RepID=UPI0030F3721B